MGINDFIVVLYNSSERKDSEPVEVDISIIIPTYNEASNILNLVNMLRSHLPRINTEIVIVDDDSPDGTGRIVEEYIQNLHTRNCNLESVTNETSLVLSEADVYSQFYQVKIFHKQKKEGLISAILEGVKLSRGRCILVMDADFSHPLKTVRKMIEELTYDPDCIVIGSRYVPGAAIEGWPITRRLISAGAIRVARYFLNLRDVRDPISGFFAIKRQIIESIDVGTKGYKILLEILVKSRGRVKIKEIPYTFVNRRRGESKLNLKVIINYICAAWQLHRYERNILAKSEKIVDRMST
jgi:dolichol-phosphate mannosyltransferase